MSTQTYPIPVNEKERLAALRRYNILDTLPEQEFNDIAKLVAYICHVPVAHVSFMAEDRQWFKATVGFEAQDVPRETTFCQYTLMEKEMWVIPDANKEPKLVGNPNVGGGFNVGFYAGIPLTSPDGFNIGTICAIDHTPKTINDDQRNALKILANHVISQLELRVKNIELDKQKEIAELAIYAKDSFLANMSHEIRTPLNAIIGFTDLIAKSKLDGTQKEYINNVQTAGENLMIIINDILDLSKIESGNLIIESHPFNLKKALKHTYDLLKVKVTPEIEFNLFLDADMPEMVTGDKGRINQILTNLAGNAIKFTTEGEITISVKKIEEIKGTYKLRFSVKDTGIGIPQEKLDTIFDRFTQAEESTTRRFGGTGLGLNIVKQLIELQNGEIHVKSRFGTGSEFYFIMDFKKTDTKPEVYQESQTTLLQPKKLVVLLCEDNILNQKLAKSVIDEFGFDLDIANNGQEGIEMFTQKQYDLVLMDLQMPVKDGYQTTEYLRNELKSDVPIIAMTAHSLVGEQQKCYNIGMNGYVPKPFKQAELLAEINRVLYEISEEEIHNFKGIDLSYLLEMSCEDKDFINEMVAIFIDKVPIETELLEKAISQNDFDSVKKIAHNLKSSLHIFKLDGLTSNLTTIETQAIKGQFNGDTIRNFDILKEGISETIEKLITY